MTSPTKARCGGASPRRRENGKNNDMTASAAESNGVAGGSHPPPARARGGRSLGPTTPSNGTARRTKRKAGSSRASTPRPRRKSRTVEESRASTPDLAELEAQIKENHDLFLVSFRSSLGHALRVGQLLLQVKEHLGHGPFTGWVGSRCPFSVESARAYMRVARNLASVEEGSKRQFATGLTLTDVLKRLVKPRAKKTATESGGADTSTKSAHPEPDEPAQVDGGGPDEATADAAATEGTGAGAAAGDGTDRAEARRDAAHEDADRRREEDGADGRRAGRADRRTRSDQEAESARDDDEATAQDPDATTVAEEQLDDAQWLASRPVRQKLADPTAFDREALVWRRTWPEVERMIRRLEARRPGLLEEVAVKRSHFCWFGLLLMEVIQYPHPDNWRVCPRCKGRGRSGRQEKTCGKCYGRGYGYHT
jgi:hypothetical protein